MQRFPHMASGAGCRTFGESPWLVDFIPDSLISFCRNFPYGGGLGPNSLRDKKISDYLGIYCQSSSLERMRRNEHWAVLFS